MHCQRAACCFQAAFLRGSWRSDLAVGGLVLRRGSASVGHPLRAPLAGVQPLEVGAVVQWLREAGLQA